MINNFFKSLIEKDPFIKGKIHKEDITEEIVGDCKYLNIPKLDLKYLIILDKENYTHISKKFLIKFSNTYIEIESSDFLAIRVRTNEFYPINFINLTTDISLYLELQNFLLMLNTYFDIQNLLLEDFTFFNSKKNYNDTHDTCILLKFTALKKLISKKSCDCEKISKTICKFCGGDVVPSFEYYLKYNHWNICTNCLEEN